MERLLVAATIVAMCGSVATADEILFKNGDRLTGTITRAAEGKLTIQTTIAGEVTVDLSEVRTFSTDEPIEIRLGDGSVLPGQTVDASDQEGVIQTQGGADAAIQPQTLELSQVSAINPPDDGATWSGAFTIGGTITRGNSKTESLSARVEAERRTVDDRLSLNAGYLFGRETAPDTGVTSTTTDNWFASGKYDYFIDPKLYVFGAMRIEKDRIADLDLRLVPSAGLGYQWVDQADLKFSTEAGLAWVYESYRDARTDEHIALRLAYNLNWAINDKVSFIHSVEYLPSLENISDFNVIAQAGIRASLTERLFAEFKFEDRYDSTPAPGALKNDLRYILGAGWRF